MDTDVVGTHAESQPKRGWFKWIIVGAVFVGLAVWSAVPRQLIAKGDSIAEKVLDCPFSQFRQILVRKDATRAVIEHGNMKLIEERVTGLDIDASQDPQPLLNVLRGKSRTEVEADKQLIVSINDPYIQTDRIELVQHASIKINGIQVSTRLEKSNANLQQYRVSLSAVPDGDKTKLEIKNSMEVAVKLPYFLSGIANRRTQAASEKASTGTLDSIGEFIAQHQSERIVLPDLKKEN